MSFYDDVYKEAEHDYDPREFDDDRPTRAELEFDEHERETNEADVRRALRCPHCGTNVSGSVHDETRHMITVHRDIVTNRLQSAGLTQGEIDNLHRGLPVPHDDDC